MLLSASSQKSNRQNRTKNFPSSYSNGQSKIPKYCPNQFIFVDTNSCRYHFCSISAIGIMSEDIDIWFFILWGSNNFYQFLFTNSIAANQNTFIFLRSFNSIYIFLIYGAGAAVLVATMEPLYTSLDCRYRKNITIKNKTILFNVMIGSISAFLMTLIAKIQFFPHLLKNTC